MITTWMQPSISKATPGACPACQHPRDSQRRMTAASTTLHALIENSLRGCIVCKIFSSAVHKIGEQSGVDLEGDWDSRITLYFNMRYLGGSLELGIIRLGVSISFFCLERSPSLETILPDLSLGCSIPERTSSKVSLEWAKRQLQQCVNSHAACDTPQSGTPALPSRLLDLQSFEAGQVSLVEAPRHIKRYACLSYCWGQRAFLRTTCENFKDHLQAMALKELPVAFVDAMYIAREFGVFYLWIDSLCIIQDDRHDWGRESAQMASIYQNAYVVLSATGLSNPHSSLFSDCAPDFHAQQADIPALEGQGKVFFRRSLAHISHLESDQLALPTLGRGWIFQERILATRMLHFGPHELMLECLEHSVCQCTAEPATTSRDTASPLLSQMSLSHGAMQLKSSFNSHNWTSWDEATLSVCWHKLVEQYSTLSLTHASDIFPAFSGVAKQFQSALESKYLAGLWEKTLLRDLLWHPQSSVDSTDGSWKRPRSWRAPSWSWASVEYPVEFIGTSAGLEPLCTVQEAVCSAVGIDPMGEVSDAHLVLQGNLIPMKLMYPHPALASPQAIRPFNLFVLEDLGKRVRNVWADACTHHEGSNHLPEGSEVHIFPVGLRTISKAIECLILKTISQSQDSDLSTYERIGLIELPRAPLDGLDGWTLPDRRTHTIKII